MTTKQKGIRDTLKSERAKVIYDELTEVLRVRMQRLEPPGHATWLEKHALALEIQKFELEQTRQIIITVSMIDLEELKLLAGTSVAMAALNKS